MPCWPPTIVQPSPCSSPGPRRTRCRSPAPKRVAEHVDRAVADRRRPRATNVDAVELRARRSRRRPGRRVEPPSTVDPVLAADDGDIADRDVVGAHDDPAADDGSRLARRGTSRRSITSGPWCDPGREVHGRRAARPRGAGAAERERRARQPRRAPQRAELAAVLGVAQAEEREAGVAENLRHDPARAEQRDGGPPNGACEAETRGRSRGRARARAAPSGTARANPAGSRAAVVDATSSCEPDRRHQRPELERPPPLQRPGEHARGDEERHERRRAASRGVPSACTTSSTFRGSSGPRTSLRRGCRRPGNAHCAATPASASVRVPSRQRRHRRVRREDDPAPAVSSSCSSTSRASSGSLREAAPEPGRADDLLGAVQRRLDPEAPVACRSLERLVPLRARRIGRRGEPRAGARAAPRGAIRW